MKKGRLTVEQIKGSMSLEDIETGMGIDAGKLNEILGLPEDLPGSAKLYDLEDIDASLTVGRVRERIDEFKN